MTHNDHPSTMAVTTHILIRCREQCSNLHLYHRLYLYHHPYLDHQLYLYHHPYLDHLYRPGTQETAAYHPLHTFSNYIKVIHRRQDCQPDMHRLPMVACRLPQTLGNRAKVIHRREQRHPDMHRVPTWETAACRLLQTLDSHIKVIHHREQCQPNMHRLPT
ncbi:hypothetical protein EDC04DRAFT_1552086 [Pisolithus marmoratus]|nr:hypothetical protein EDC04DRAFT_1552086 [Pisolithus marmoratus]